MQPSLVMVTKLNNEKQWNPSSKLLKNLIFDDYIMLRRVLAFTEEWRALSQIITLIFYCSEDEELSLLQQKASI